MQHIGKQIKMLVDKSGLKQKDIAAVLSEKGISVQQLQNIFGKENIDTKYLVKFSELLNVPIIEFFGEGNTKEYNELLSTVESQKQIINSLKHKLYIIDSIIYGIRGFYGKKFKTLSDSLIKELESNDNFQVNDTLILMALDAITNIDKDPDKLAKFQEVINGKANGTIIMVRPE